MTSQTITAEIIDLQVDDDGTIRDSGVTIASQMNLSEEFAITTAQYTLSTDLGCDIERVERLEVEATYMGGSDFQWLVNFHDDTEDEED